jgi:hypothetical protein
LLGASPLNVDVVQSELAEAFPNDGVVVAAVEMQCVDVGEQPDVGDGFDRRDQHRDVVAVGAVDRPAEGDSVAFRCHWPLPPRFGPVSGVGAGSLASVGRLVQRSIDGDLGQIETDDPVESGERLGLQLVEHSRRDPLVASSAQRRVWHPMFQDRFDVDPWSTGCQPNQQSPQAQPVRHPPPVAAQRVIIDGLGQYRLDGRPHGVDDVGLECDHVSDLPGRLALGRTRHENRANPPTGGWSPSEQTFDAYPRDS